MKPGAYATNRTIERYVAFQSEVRRNTDGAVPSRINDKMQIHTVIKSKHQHERNFHPILYGLACTSQQRLSAARPALTCRL